MGVLGHPELFTCLTRDFRIVALHHGIAKDGLLLPSNPLNLVREREGKDLRTRPRSKPATLPIVVASGKEELGPNQQDLLVQAEYATVVQGVVEVDGHPNVAKDILG